MKKKLIRISAIFCAIVLLLSGVLSTVGVHAAGTTEDAKKMAIAKMYFRSLYYCVGGTATQYKNIEGSKIDAESIANSNWFGGTRNTKAGAFVENEVLKKFGKGLDAEFYCGDDNELVAHAIVQINAATGGKLTTADLACGLGENGKGVFKASGEFAGETCKSTLQKVKTGELSHYQGESAFGSIFHSAKKLLVLDDNRQVNLENTVKSALGSDPTKFTNEEMYFVYLLNFEAGCTTEYGAEAGEGSYEIAALGSDGQEATRKYTKSKTSKIGLTQSKTENRFVYPDESGGWKTGEMKCDDIAKVLKDQNNKYTKAYLTAAKKEQQSGGKPAGPGTTKPDINVYNEEDNEKCYNATSLGWAVCPLIELMQGAVINLYAESIEPLLVTKTEIVSNSREGWNTFQSIANVSLVIFILFIIISQLTGFGIDNYGIKKSLPKIIVAAVLINMSFIICQLSVDISNILGSSLNSFFASQIDKSKLSEEYQNVTIPVQNASSADITAGTLGGVVTVVGGAIASIAIGGWTVALMAIPVVLGALFSALIAVLFFFVLLGARQAGVVILTILSPVAIACIILPNTKKVFDRWLKLFSGVLLVYPIAGALMGGGAYASYVLLRAGGGDNHWYDLAAMLISVLPFFLIPSLLKGSFAAAGNLGAKISGVGNRVGGRLSGSARRMSMNAINNNQGVKNARLQNERKRQTRYAKRIVGKYGNVATSQLDDKQRLRLANAQQILNQRTMEDAKAKAGIAPVSEEDLIEQEKLKQENANVEAIEARITRSGDYDDTEKLQAGLTTAIGTGDTASIRAYQNVLSKKGESGRQAVHNAMVKAEENARAKGTTISSAARRAYASNIMNKWSDDYKNNSRSTFDYAKANTGETAGGTISSYYAQNADNLKPEQMVKMDDAELARYKAALSDPSRKTKIQQLAYKALYDERLKGGMKGNRENELKEIAGDYTPPVDSEDSKKQPDPVDNNNHSEFNPDGAGGNNEGSGSKPETSPSLYGAGAEFNNIVNPPKVNPGSGMDTVNASIQRQRQAEQAKLNNENDKKIILP